MTDRRFLAANGRVALAGLQGQVAADRFVEAVPMTLTACAFLRSEPDGARDRQMLIGDRFDVLEAEGDHAFGVSAKDGYVGYLPRTALGGFREATHWVSVLLTHAWAAASIKSEPVEFVPMTAGVQVLGEVSDWFEVALCEGTGFVPRRHLSPFGQWSDSVVDVARTFEGTPYVWAGNEPSGIDCSGLVQVAFRACGFSCPPDSDVQAEMAGQRLGATDALEAGDLVFWAGHVAIASGQGTIVHANAHHMAVVEEPFPKAEARIAKSDTGPVTSRLRPNWAALKL